MNSCQRCVAFELGLTKPSFYEMNSDTGWMPARIIVDSDALNEILQKSPRPVHYLPKNEPTLQYMVDHHEIFPEHVDHVDETIPISLGEYTFVKDDQSELFHICDDGHHRIAKCLRLGVDVPFYLFTEAEMRQCCYPTLAEYMRSRGIFVLGQTDEEIDKMFLDVK